jgi:hypothetical protein
MSDMTKIHVQRVGGRWRATWTQRGTTYKMIDKNRAAAYKRAKSLQCFIEHDHSTS